MPWVPVLPSYITAFEGANALQRTQRRNSVTYRVLHRALWKLVPESSAGPGRPACVPDVETELAGSEEEPGEVGRMCIPGRGRNTCDELKSLMWRMLKLWR